MPPCAKTLEHFLGKTLEVWLVKTVAGQHARIRGRVSNYDNNYIIVENPLVPISINDEWGPLGPSELIIPASTIYYIMSIES